MFSVTNTGTCFRPSWTAKVCPTMSGVIVDRRLHVLMSRFSPLLFMSRTFFIRWSSTKKPFFKLLAIFLLCCPYTPRGGQCTRTKDLSSLHRLTFSASRQSIASILLALSPANDVLLRSLIVSSLLSESLVAPSVDGTFLSTNR